MSDPLLSIEDLQISAGGKAVVEEVNLSIAPGEMVGLVGESGCGKSVTALSVLRLLAEPQIGVTGGRLIYDGTDLRTLPEKRMEAIRGDEIAMIFQEPMTSLNPVFTIGAQMAESLRLHRRLSARAARDEAGALLARVGIPAPQAALDRYPHEMSGGQRQRAMIAIALACGPRLLVADEPTTALDVTVQAQILDLLDGLRRETGMAVLLITHDLGVVSQYCDRVAVMYGGRIVEEAAAETLFAAPRHRYTEALLATIPAANAPGAKLPAIPGLVPPPGQRPPGCAFAPRCRHVIERCRTEMPPLDGDAHKARCWNPA
ncbi:ABC transporter ATP-binding protein [Wenxinia saemankumensis]|uniref:Peptide/nickel transport system ATP-binding protein n=1 Tax=Wenxinia saemankumensis TaxID=1447782 RepID=A0A1M6A2S4_9RHOB|nr:ABC transporter ATP-binding protein [Wenxinia saemankumensis]SHI30801.1 peptide/nickel transport system ATP-binding protein [Wenxinia saemankumensis]